MRERLHVQAGSELAEDLDRALPASEEYTG